jgi:hypothetical protein
MRDYCQSTEPGGLFAVCCKASPQNHNSGRLFSDDLHCGMQGYASAKVGAIGWTINIALVNLVLMHVTRHASDLADLRQPIIGYKDP